MSLINEIKKTLNVKDEKGNPRGWKIIYIKNKITEVIQLYNPKQHKGDILNDMEVIEILTNYKRAQNEN